MKVRLKMKIFLSFSTMAFMRVSAPIRGVTWVFLVLMSLHCLILLPGTAAAAVTQTLLIGSANGTNLSSYTTASITPTANNLVLVWVTNSKASTPDTPTLTYNGTGLTFVQVATVTWGTIATPLKRTTLFRAMGASPTAGTITIGFGGVTQTGCLWSVHQFGSVDISGTNGSGAVVQSVTNRVDSPSTALSITLAALGDASNATAGGFSNAINSATSISAGDGYTALTGQTHNSPATSLRAEWRADGSTTVNVTSTSSAIAGIAVEIKSDKDPPTPNPMTFATAPDNASASSISMTSTAGTDSTTPVQYLFTLDNSTCNSDAGTGGTSSSWQESTSYTDDGLQANKCYGYTVQARDSVSPTPNTGTASSASKTYTSANVPGTPTLGNPSGCSLALINDANGNPSSNPTTLFAVQVVTTSPSDSNWLNKWVDSNGDPFASEVWMSDATLDALRIRGLKARTTYGVKVKAKNQDGDATSLSTEGQGTTPSWWDCNYAYRKKITLTNNSGGSVVTNTIVRFITDTQTLITGSKLRSDGKDWRIVYYNPSTGTETEIAQKVDSGWNTSSTETWFRLQADIANGSSDDNYYFYYGYSSESTSPSSLTPSTNQTLYSQTSGSGQTSMSLDWDNGDEWGGAQGFYFNQSYNCWWRITKIEFYVNARGTSSSDKLAGFVFTGTNMGEGDQVTNGKGTEFNNSDVTTGWNTASFSSPYPELKESTTYYAAILPTNPTDRSAAAKYIRWDYSSTDVDGNVQGYHTNQGASSWQTSLMGTSGADFVIRVYGDEAANEDCSSSLGSEQIPGTFLYKKSVTIQSSKIGSSCSANLSNFPLLVSETGDWLKNNANGGKIENANGYDIIFRNSSGEQLKHEIEKYDGTNGVLIAWVKIPDLDYNDNTAIYMYYGNAAISSSSAKPTEVWDTSVFSGVWHLGESSGNALDSTSYGTNGGVTGTVTRPSTGQIGNAYDFGTNGQVAPLDPVDGHLDFGTGSFTVSFWLNVDDTTGNYQLPIWKGSTTQASPGYDVEINDTVTAIYFGITDSSDTSGGHKYSPGASLSLDTPTYIVGVVDRPNNRLRIYKNGLQQGTGTDITGVVSVSSDSPLCFPVADYDLDGMMDEVRILKVARDTCWNETEYNNQNIPSGTGGFYELGTEQAPAPTAVTLTSLTATEYEGGKILLEWKTGHEVSNLGFHVYREENGELYRLTPEILAGSALMAGSRTALNAGHSYFWWDTSLSAPSSQLSGLKYWVKDMDLNGTETIHGPVTPIFSQEPLPEKVNPEVLSEVGAKLQEKYWDYWKVQELMERLQLAPEVRGALRVRSLRTGNEVPSRSGPTGLEGGGFHRQPDLAANEVQRYLAGKPGVKLFVREEGWYRVTQPELVAAGLSPKINPRYLQLYVEGREQPIRVIGEKDGRFGPQDSIEFYGTGIDTLSTDTRVYWLIGGLRVGQRIEEHWGGRGLSGGSSFLHTVEKKDRTIYISALKNGDEENFFGAVVSRKPVDQVLRLSHLDPGPFGEAILEVSLQGVMDGAHRVRVRLNGSEVGEVVFEKKSKGVMKWAISQSGLHEGENLVSLIAEGGAMDVSLVDYIRLTYWHTYTADSDSLKLTAQGGRQVTLDGFSNSAIRVVDITEPSSPIQLRGVVNRQGLGYSVSLRVPGTGQRTLLAFTEARVKSPKGVLENKVSSWHERGQGYDLVILSHGDFLGSLQPLKTLRELQGLKVALVDVEDVYDEFSFGVKGPRAIKDFLALTRASWRRSPRFVLLVGDASFDPRNYYRFGDVDYVPTKLIDTVYMETASDDWFVDFNNDGLSEMAIGRLPVQKAEEASLIVSKIVGYEQVGRLNGALLVADRKGENDLDFEAATEEVRALLPSSIVASKISRSSFRSDGEARGEILRSINQGPLLVNFIGHGTVWGWNGDLLSTGDADDLTNGMRLSFFIGMTCLNGWFHDPYLESLAEALLKAKGGGAVAVWTSSGLTEPDEQTVMNKELIKLLFGKQGLTLGEATARAKASVSDQDIRRTWILFGDPATRLRQ